MAFIDFLKDLRDAVPTLDPLFFFTDKDDGQMDAIRSVFDMRPSLCYWRVKRAIKIKLHELQRSGSIQIVKCTEKELIDRIDYHFKLHPLISDYETVEQIRVFCVSDISGLYGGNQFQSLFTYLMNNWYEPEKFVTWGRRSTVIPFTRTTMMVEGHWSLLKHHYLVLHNRPQPDFFMHIINQKIVFTCCL